MFDKEHEITGKAAKAAQAVVESVAKVLSTGIDFCKGPGEKVAMISGAAIPSLGALATILGPTIPDNEPIIPSADGMAFASCYLIACTEDASKDGQPGLAMGFSLEYVEKALEIYSKVMGRNYDRIHPEITKMLQRKAELEAKAMADVPVHLKKFIPQ